MVTLTDAVVHLGFEADCNDAAVLRNVRFALNAGRARLRGAIGDRCETVLAGDGSLDMLLLTYTAEVYDHRADRAAGKVESARAHCIDDMEQQCRLAYAIALKSQNTED